MTSSKTRLIGLRLTSFLVLFSGMVLVLSRSASAQDLLSGHVGVAFPLVTHMAAGDASTTTTLSDSFNIIFPFGVGVRPNGFPVVFDFEFVPEVHPANRSVTLLVHPGVVLPLPRHWAVGVRAAFEINQNSLGFTPLVARSFPLAKSKKMRWFVEGDLPVRFSQLSTGANATSVTFALHLGLGF